MSAVRATGVAMPGPVARGAIVSTLAVAVAALGHVAAGGQAPAAMVLLLAVALVAPVFIYRARRCMGRGWLLGALSAAQVVVHLLSRAAVPDPAALSNTVSRSSHDLMGMSGQLPLGQAAPAMPAHSGTLMLATHLLAIIACALLLATLDSSLLRYMCLAMRHWTGRTLARLTQLSGANRCARYWLPQNLSDHWLLVSPASEAYLTLTGPRPPPVLSLSSTNAAESARRFTHS